MINKNLVIAFLILLVIVSLAIMPLRRKEPTIIQDDSILIKAREHFQKKRTKDSLEIVRLKNNKTIIRDSIFIERIKYKIIYEKITHSTSVERNAAFDSLLSN